MSRCVRTHTNTYLGGEGSPLFTMSLADRHHSRAIATVGVTGCKSRGLGHGTDIHEIHTATDTTNGSRASTDINKQSTNNSKVYISNTYIHETI